MEGDGEMLSFELNPIDRHFAAFIRSEAGECNRLQVLMAALVSNVLAAGHICLDLAEIAGSKIVVSGEEIQVPGLDELRESITGLRVTGAPGNFSPLILDRDRLYLQRYWNYEKRLIDGILGRVETDIPETDMALLKEGIARLFPADGREPDRQKVAAVMAMKRRFLVISGGPGTGKTSTVVKIIALLLEQARDKDLRIALSAPTGKAATRLDESIRSMKGGLVCGESIREKIPAEVATIHRLLGIAGGSGKSRFSRENTLPHDVVIVDEASMVPLPLMSRLVSAMSGHSRLILLGDKDQLASVEAGAALGDICGRLDDEPFSDGFGGFIQEASGERVPVATAGRPSPPLTDSLVILKRNYRFSRESGIGGVGSAIREGKGDEALARLRGDSSPDLKWRRSPPPAGMKGALAEAVMAGYGRGLSSASPEEALASFDRFRILCAVRKGPYGVEALNSLCEGILAERGWIDRACRWYHGRPVMVTVNDYNLRLFNGDVGIALADPGRSGEIRVFFLAPDGGVRSLSPVRLPAHETVFAMTVHKSQGSEFDSLLLVLPATDSEILTRELIYTAVTRARKGVEIWGDEKLFVNAVERRISRRSGLRDALWPND
jgi:exodeoxyribonuclease V alpha subunit